MSDHSPERVAVLAEAFKAGWHFADDANLPDRTHHGILAVLESAELADLVAWKVHEALERAAEAVRMSEMPPRYVMGIDPVPPFGHWNVTAGIWAIPDNDFRIVDPPRRLCSLEPGTVTRAEIAAEARAEALREAAHEIEHSVAPEHPNAGYRDGHAHAAWVVRSLNQETS